MGTKVSRNEIAEMMAELDAIAAGHGIVWKGAELGPAGGVDTSERTRYKKPGTGSGRGVVRKVSDAQVRFMRRLMAERNTQGMRFLPGSEDIENMSLAGARDLIERLLACPMKPDAPVERMSTPKQAEWLKKMSGKDVPADIEAIRLKGEGATFAEASKALDILFKAKNVVVVTQTQATRKDDTLTIGLYRHNDGRIVRVQKAKQGTHLYGLVLDRENGDAWIYTRGCTTGLIQANRMTLEEAEALSLALGCCCMCGMVLTATVNGVGPGMRWLGPICATKI